MPSAMENLGIVTFLMMRSPHFREMTLGQIHAITLPPLAKQLAVTATIPNKTPDGPPVPMAFALFAKVNDEWDAKLRDPDFKLHDLPPEAWDGGGNKWLVELLSTQKASGMFVEKAARSVWPNGGTLHIRARDEKGKTELGKRRF